MSRREYHPIMLTWFGSTWSWSWPRRLRRWLVLQLQAARLARAIRRATRGGVVGLLLLAGAPVTSAQAAAAPAPLDEPGVWDQLVDAWPEVEAAAQLTDTDLLLAGLLIHESRLQPIAAGGRDAAHWGPGQVRWGIWGRPLTEAGVVEPGDGREALAEGDGRGAEGPGAATARAEGPGWTGILAAAWVLAELRATYGPGTRWNRGGECVLCVYNRGPAGLRQRSGCGYSRTVLWLRDGVRARLAGGAAVAVAQLTSGQGGAR